MIILKKTIGKYHLVLRTAMWSDAADLAELDQICFTVPWTRRSFESDLSDTKKNVYLIWEANSSDSSAVIDSTAVLEEGQNAAAERVIVGYGGFWQIVDDAEIMNIAIHPEWRCLNLASELLRSLIAIAEKRNLKSISLEVRTGNNAALALYRSFGFEQSGIRRKYYPDNEEDAIIMLKKI